MLLVAAGCGSSGRRPRPNSGPNRRRKPQCRTCAFESSAPTASSPRPVEVPMLVLSDAEWRLRLTPEQYRITRAKDTEPAFCGGLLNNKKPGMYVCVCCNLPLFESAAKFESGSGWPSFFQPAAKENIREQRDTSHHMVRTEILCQRCGAHLGHVFDDGPRADRQALLPELRGAAVRRRRSTQDDRRTGTADAGRARALAGHAGETPASDSGMPATIRRGPRRFSPAAVSGASRPSFGSSTASWTSPAAMPAATPAPPTTKPSRPD